MLSLLKGTDPTKLLFGGILLLLSLTSVVGWALQRMLRHERAAEMLKTLNARVRLWWAMCGVFAVAALTGGLGSVLVFGFTSFLLLREFVTITPTRKGDHRTLFWVFFIILPLQYYLLWTGWYGLFIIMIPVYAFLFIPLRMALAGDAHGFLERAAKIQWALMICVYCISHAPALMKIDFEGGPRVGLRLLLYLCLLVQVNDVVQLMTARALDGVPSRNNESERFRAVGLGAGLVVSTGLGMALSWATPFSVLQSAAMSVLIVLMGTAGTLCYAAIVQDRGRPGVVVVATRPSMTQRVISLCFAAPVFFHIARYYFTAGPGAPF